MAKGLRSSVRKHNKAVLRAKLFGPAADARTERLSAKLQELSSRPKDADMEDADVNIIDKSSEKQTEEGDVQKDMEIDGQESTKSKTSTGRIRKRARTRSRSKAVFAPHPSKLKQNNKKR